MKRYVTWLIISMMLVGLMLAGCPNSGPAQTSNSKDKSFIGVAIYKFDDTFMTGVRNAISQAAEGKAQVEIVDSQNS